MSAPENWRFETKQIHTGAQPDPLTKARATPIYQTTSYVFDSADHAANLFALAEFGNIYTRIQNPTQDVLEQRLAALEGGASALSFASGLAAEDALLRGILKPGDHVVLGNDVYGGTYRLLTRVLAPWGIETTTVELGDLDEVRAAIAPDRLLVFDVAEGWEPLCGFLGVPVPDTPFPHHHLRADFWEVLGGEPA